MLNANCKDKSASLLNTYVDVYILEMMVTSRRLKKSTSHQWNYRNQVIGKLRMCGRQSKWVKLITEFSAGLAMANSLRGLVYVRTLPRMYLKLRSIDHKHKKGWSTTMKRRELYQKFFFKIFSSSFPWRKSDWNDNKPCRGPNGRSLADAI